MQYFQIVKFSIVLFVAGYNAISPSDAKELEHEIVSVATGGVGGIYFRIGSEICEAFNSVGRLQGIWCEIRVTAGSKENLDLLIDGSVDIAVLQSDVIISAPEAFLSKMAVISPLYSESLHVIASRKSGIKAISDMLGKRINTGLQGSGSNSIANSILRKWDISNQNSILIELSPDEQQRAICDDEIDASFWVAGFPNSMARRVIEECGAYLLSVDLSDYEEISRDHPVFKETVIPRGTYSVQEADVKSFGLSAYLVTRRDASEKLVSLVSEVVESSFERTFSQIDGFSTALSDNQLAIGIPLHSSISD